MPCRCGYMKDGHTENVCPYPGKIYCYRCLKWTEHIRADCPNDHDPEYAARLKERAAAQRNYRDNSCSRGSECEEFKKPYTHSGTYKRNTKETRGPSTNRDESSDKKKSKQTLNKKFRKIRKSQVAKLHLHRKGKSQARAFLFEDEVDENYTIVNTDELSRQEFQYILHSDSEDDELLKSELEVSLFNSDKLETLEKIDFILDSGCTSHIVKNAGNLVNYRMRESPKIIRVANRDSTEQILK